MICHDRPYLSLSQPHLLSSPPSAVSLSHSSSTSSCEWQFTRKEIDSLNLNSGPAFSPMNSCPSSSKLTDMALPLGPGVTPRTFEFLKMETYRFIASSASVSNHKNGVIFFISFSSFLFGVQPVKVSMVIS